MKLKIKKNRRILHFQIWKTLDFDGATPAKFLFLTSSNFIIQERIYKELKWDQRHLSAVPQSKWWCYDVMEVYGIRKAPKSGHQ